MRRASLMLTGLLFVVIDLAARSYVDRPRRPIDTFAGIETNAPVAVVSTLRRACFDCHSDKTRWPWYASLPAAWWLIERDVRAGRGQLDFTHWPQYSRFERADLLDKMCELASTRTMPLWPYRMLHQSARLSDVEISTLCAWTHTEAARETEEGR